MEWSTTSWLPQNFLALRQNRFEAFNGWKVPAIIAAIPALLEIALILFFAGLIVFLWTFNPVVAGVSIAVIAISIVLAVLATVLPVFHRQCPYKSPTGWACLRVVWLFLFDRCTSWRKRDFSGDGEDVVDKAAVDVLRCTKVRFRDKHDSLEVHRITDADRRTKALGDLAALHRAFTWIYDTSQNECLLQAVEQCAVTRVTEGCPPLALLAFDFSAACQALDMDPKKMCEHLDKLYDITLIDDRVQYAALPHRSRDWRMSRDLKEQIKALQDTRPQLLHQLAETLARDLGLFFDYNYLLGAYYNETSARFLMRIIALCTSLTWIMPNDQRTFLDYLAPHFYKLCKMDRALPGLSTSLFELLALHHESIMPEHRECPIFTRPWSYL